MEAPEFYDTLEFAKIMKVNPQSIRRAIYSGHIQAIRATGGKKAHYRIPAIEIQRLCDMAYTDNQKQKQKKGK